MDWLTIVRARRAQNPRGYSEGMGGEGLAETTQSGAVRNLRIIGPIDWLFGVDAIALSADLLAEPRPEQVNVYLDSPGGDLFDALTLRAALDTLTTAGVRINTQAGAVVGSTNRSALSAMASTPNSQSIGPMIRRFRTAPD